MSQFSRAIKYRNFRNEVKKIARKFSSAETNPFGRDAIMGLHKYEVKYDKLNDKWRRSVDAHVERAINAYHKPVVQGGNGEWYSAAEMDYLMLHG